jgi:hypothetical protein
VGSPDCQRESGSSCTSRDSQQRLLRPVSEELTVAFYEGCKLEPRKFASSLVGAASPHANHGRRVEVSESIDDDGMVTEVLFQQRPLARNRCGRILFHCKYVPRCAYLSAATACSKIKKAQRW